MEWIAVGALALFGLISWLIRGSKNNKVRARVHDIEKGVAHAEGKISQIVSNMEERYESPALEPDDADSAADRLAEEFTRSDQ